MPKPHVNIADVFAKQSKRYCRFCKLGIEYVDYKNIDFLSNFVNDQVKILPNRYTGNCKKHQKRVAIAVKRARHLALMPFVGDNYKQK